MESKNRLSINPEFEKRSSTALEKSARKLPPPRMMLALLLALGALGGMAESPQAFAQQAVLTQPGQANSADSSGSLTGTNSFQLIWASARGAANGSTASRAGCLVMNNSTHRQWVYFQGPGMTTPTAANSTTLEARAVPLEAAAAANAQGGYVTCATGGGQVLQDSIWIAGTSGDTYVAKQQ